MPASFRLPKGGLAHPRDECGIVRPSKAKRPTPVSASADDPQTHDGALDSAAVAPPRPGFGRFFYRFLRFVRETRTSGEGTRASGPYREPMTLHACTRCGGTLTDAFRFCPACGLSNDDTAWLAEPKPALTFPLVEPRRRSRPARRTWSTRVRRGARTRLASAGSASTALTRRVLAVPHRLLQRLDARARQGVAAFGDATRLLVEVVLVTAGSARDALRWMVLLRRLHARRAAVIYSSGCAALSGDDRGVRHAQAELRMLDDLISAAAGPATRLHR
jgi:hypothetical protein